MTVARRRKSDRYVENHTPERCFSSFEAMLDWRIYIGTVPVFLKI